MENENKCPVRVITQENADLKYTLSSVNDFETLLFLQKFAQKNFKAKENIITASAFVLTIVLYLMGFILPAFFTLVIFYINFGKLINIKKTVKKYISAFPDREFTYSFYDDFFIAEAQLGSSCIPYDKVKKFYDTDSYLIIHLSASDNYIIKKSQYDFNSSEFTDFLFEKTKKQA